MWFFEVIFNKKFKFFFNEESFKVVIEVDYLFFIENNGVFVRVFFVKIEFLYVINIKCGILSVF